MALIKHAATDRCQFIKSSQPPRNVDDSKTLTNHSHCQPHGKTLLSSATGGEPTLLVMDYCAIAACGMPCQIRRFNAASTGAGLGFLFVKKL